MIISTGAIIRDRSQTLVSGGGWCKKGALNILTLVRGHGALETCFSMGLTRNFHGKKGGPWIFLSSEGGTPNFFLHQAPPYKCLWTVPNIVWIRYSYDNYRYIMLKGVQHLLPKLSMFYVISQNNQQLFEK